MSADREDVDLIRQVARIVRQAYIDERSKFESKSNMGNTRYVPGPKWDGQKLPDGKVVKPIWPKIARYAIQHQLNPELLVRRQFFPGQRRAPMPNQLTSNWAREQYEAKAVDDAQLVQSALRFEVETCRDRVLEVYDDSDWTEQEVWGNVLTDATVPISPLFRCCTAHRMGPHYKFVQQQYGQDALVQYLQHKVLYDKHWADWIPTGFKRKAEAVYNRVA